jgi:hypothetical protein
MQVQFVQRLRTAITCVLLLHGGALFSFNPSLLHDFQLLFNSLLMYLLQIGLPLPNHFVLLPFQTFEFQGATDARQVDAQYDTDVDCKQEAQVRNQ